MYDSCPFKAHRREARRRSRGSGSGIHSHCSGGAHSGEAGTAQAVGRPASKQRLREGLGQRPIKMKNGLRHKKPKRRL